MTISKPLVGISDGVGLSQLYGLSPSSGLSPPLVDPSDLPNLAIWFDASDTSTLTFNSTTISGWKNKGNMGIGNAAQGTALRQPLYVANSIGGKPGLRGKHNGVHGSYMTITTPSMIYTQFTHFVVFQRAVDTGLQERISGKYDTAVNDREQMIQISTADTINGFIDADGASGSTNVVGVPTPTLAVGVPYIAMHRYNGTNNYSNVNRNNGGTSAYTGGVFNASGDYQLFNSSTFGENFDGLICEDIFFTRLLNAAEELQIFQYLAAKYGIAI